MRVHFCISYVTFETAKIQPPKVIFALARVLLYVKTICSSTSSNTNFTPSKYKLRLSERLIFIAEKSQFVDVNFVFESANNKFDKVNLHIWTHC